MVTRTKWYARVNSAWPERVPELNAEEAQRAARKLIRFALGNAVKVGDVQVTSGNRYSWVRGGIVKVNPDRGWKSLVHDLSHWAHKYSNTGDKPHDSSHARMELRMIKRVVSSGWLDGSLKTPEAAPEPAADPSADRQALRLLRAARIDDRIERWEAKAKRAERALAKLRRQARYYQRTLAA
jgi:hypothetical protein